jgi:hypothetical protein
MMWLSLLVCGGHCRGASMLGGCISALGGLDEFETAR